MANKIPWDKIQNYLQHSKEPYDNSFKAWLRANSDNEKLWKEMQMTYALLGEIPESYIPNEAKGWNRINSRIEDKHKKSSLNQFIFRIAASILLILIGGAGSWFIFNQTKSPVYTEIYSPYGHKTKIILPDSSLVWLNGDTHLKYETSFAHSRIVELTGEALFEIKKDQKKVFQVKSGELKVEVYGTTFNFKHYQEEEDAEIALLEGSVGLFNKDKFLTKMAPGEVAAYDLNTEHVTMTTGNINQIISWSTDELIIENEKFIHVLNYLERWYGVDITVDDNLIINQHLSFKVKTESLQELLSIIDHISPIQYKIDGKHVTITKRIQ